MRIDYWCMSCGVRKANYEIDSMVCTCGGEFRPDGALFGQAAVFHPYYDRVLRSYVSSYRQQERLAHAHRSNAHPEGLTIINDDHKFRAECRNIARHKEDYKASMYPGYRPGDKGRYRDLKPDAHHHIGRIFSYK